jgi:hypothetical protein
MVDNVKGSLKVEEDDVSDTAGFEERMKDGGVSARRVVTTESGLYRLYSSPACSIKSTEK